MYIYVLINTQFYKRLYIYYSSLCMFSIHYICLSSYFIGNQRSFEKSSLTFPWLYSPPVFSAFQNSEWCNSINYTILCCPYTDYMYFACYRTFKREIYIKNLPYQRQQLLWRSCIFSYRVEVTQSTESEVLFKLWAQEQTYIYIKIIFTAHADWSSRRLL